ncbi:MAG: PEGA domain-containing protein [bacterium]|nr:PEGA domain-containing protein [bacterium]
MINKINKNIRSGLIFLIAAFIVIFGTIILVALARGYTYDFISGQLKQTGLVIIDSAPNGAEIFINNKRIKHKTPYRLTYVDPGKMIIHLEKAKYRNWEKNLQVTPERVSFSDYAWLLPIDLKIQTITNEPSITQVTQSKNFHKITYTALNGEPSLWTFENNQANKIYQPATETDPNKQVSSVSNLILSDDGSQILFKQSSPMSTNYMLLSASPNQKAINLNETFKFNFTDGSLSFNPDNNKELIWADSGVIRKINADSLSISAVLTDKVIFSKIMDKKIFYFTDDQDKRQLWMMDLNGQRKTKLLSDVKRSSFYKMEFAKFNDINYLSVLTDDNNLTLYDHIYDNPKDNLLSKEAVDATFSKSGRYLVINTKRHLKTYDLELNERYSVADNLKDLTDWKWIDSSHMIVLADGKLRMVDFDGQNNQVLVENVKFLPVVMVNPNNKSAYSVYQQGGSTNFKLNEIFLTLKN